MHRHYRLFREHVSSCDDPDTDMEIEIILLIDHDYDTDNLIRLKDTTTDQELFNSYSDFTSILSNRGRGISNGDKPSSFDAANTIFFDLCVPRNHTYLVTILDRKRNGFSNGLARIFRDRQLYALVDGNFGEAVILEINENTDLSLPLIITSDDLERATAAPIPPATVPRPGTVNHQEEPVSSSPTTGVASPPSATETTTDTSRGTTSTLIFGPSVVLAMLLYA